ncbi:MAG: hypothetical protein M4579_000972 [Chaenotheca gracillima]|nr:MAG: hypothetical protein M4579_000972 [Chaenotheca gracillima]
MSPSGMLSYLRPHQKRTPSPLNVGGPHPPAGSNVGQNAASRPLSSLSEEDRASPASFDGSVESSPTVSPYPPVLPPIPRVASHHLQLAGALNTPGTDREARNEQERSYRVPLREQNSSLSGLPISPGIQWSNQPSASTERGPYEPPRSNAVSAQAHHSKTSEIRPQDTRSVSTPSYTVSDHVSQVPSNHRPSFVFTDDMPQGSSSTSPSEGFVENSRINEMNSRPTSSQHSRSGKTRLNLLNPMSLLLRRRSSQALSRLHDHSSNKNSSVPALQLPDDYDPRIRGKGVHDFSAPKSAKATPKAPLLKPSAPILSAEGRSITGGSSDLGEASLEDRSQGRYTSRVSRGGGEGSKSVDKEYIPAFKEHFDELVDDSGGVPQTTTLGEDHSSEDGMLNKSTTLPPFARRLPPTADTSSSRKTGMLDDRYHSHPPKRLPPPVPAQEQTQVAVSTDDVKPVTAPEIDSSFHPAGLPKHLSSNASRFSFDLVGGGSAKQEKLLEEKHRSRVSAKRRGPDVKPSSETDSDYDDDYELDPEDDYDGFEEKIPGINADEDGVELQSRSDTVSHFHFTPDPQVSANYSPIDSGIRSMTPRDQQGQVIGSAMSTELGLPLRAYDSSPQSSREIGKERVAGLGLGNIANGLNQTTLALAGDTDQKIQKTGTYDQRRDDDDLYFDDGLIDHSDYANDNTFDETTSDGEPNKPSGLERHSAAHQAEDVHVSSSSQEDRQLGTDIENEDNRIMIDHKGMRLSQPEPDSNDQDDRETILGNDQEHLDAYHGALAAAANAAAEKGEFFRAGEKTRRSPDEEHGSNFDRVRTETGRVTDLTQPSFNDDITAYEEDFGDEVDLENDPMIAAANAEALANDYEGFYGQEFGFYSQTNGANTIQTYGGFFGPALNDGISRSQSGRYAVREPNLTPITERSEFSNRNSFVSLQLPGAQSQPVQSPGLAQLSSLIGPFEGDDLSLSGLMKLRRGAWGGSNASLHSNNSTGSPVNTSPLSYAPPSETDFPTRGQEDNTRASLGSSPISSDGTHSTKDADSGFDSESPAASPTITTTNLVGTPVSTAHRAEVTSSPGASPIKRSIRAEAQGHSRTGSFADSVSYITEEDEDGSKRWILERRRTTDTGEIEVIGREIVESGRI